MFTDSSFCWSRRKSYVFLYSLSSFLSGDVVYSKSDRLFPPVKRHGELGRQQKSTKLTSHRSLSLNAHFDDDFARVRTHDEPRFTQHEDHFDSPAYVVVVVVFSRSNSFLCVRRLVGFWGEALGRGKIVITLLFSLS